MPKVSNFSCRIGGKVHYFDIYYSKAAQFHVKDFPNYVLNVINDNRSIYTTHWDTERQLVDSLKGAVDKYHKITQSQRKVIIYSVQATTEIRMNRVGKSHWQGTKPGISEKVQSLGHDTGWGFVIDYLVAIEIHHNGLQYHHVNDDGSIRYKFNPDKDDLIIDWTQQREDSFKQITQSLEDMVKKVSSFLCDTENAKLLLDSNQLLLS